MDRFVRYEAQLSREFDQILNQLERVQRMRRGPARVTDAQRKHRLGI